MAPYQFFLLFVAVLFIGVGAVTYNQASNTAEETPSHVVVESLPETPAMTVVPDTVRL